MPCHRGRLTTPPCVLRAAEGRGGGDEIRALLWEPRHGQRAREGGQQRARAGGADQVPGGTSRAHSAHPEPERAGAAPDASPGLLPLRPLALLTPLPFSSRRSLPDASSLASQPRQGPPMRSRPDVHQGRPDSREQTRHCPGRLHGGADCSSGERLRGRRGGSGPCDLAAAAPNAAGQRRPLLRAFPPRWHCRAAR